MGIDEKKGWQVQGEVRKPVCFENTGSRPRSVQPDDRTPELNRHPSPNLKTDSVDHDAAR
jgi:hypothetical protein